MLEFDYIIVGAGSAGCVLADRLTASGRNSVLVLEAGGSDRRFWIKVPIGYGRTFYDTRVAWCYRAEPDPMLGGRSAYWPRGKVVGGSSSINALIYCRGLPPDFDDWRDAGNPGWGWSDVAPHFERLETRCRGRSRQGSGPVHVTDVSREIHPASRHFFAAAREMSLPVTDDFNGPHPEGVGFYQITTRNGFRWSAADAFLRPALARGRCELVTRVLVKRILIESGQARGVEYLRGGRTLQAMARRGVIVSAGAVNSPQILQLSGIGPGALLQAHGIPVVAHREAVGANLQDHLAIDFFFKAREPTLNDILYPWRGKIISGLRYIATRSGPLSTSVNHCGGFVRSNAEATRPDLQLYFNPITYRTAPANKRPLMNPDPFSGFILSYQPCRPKSRGRIEIGSPDPMVPPRIMPNSLTDAADIADILAGGRFMKRMVATEAMARLIAEPIPPSILDMSDDDMIEDFKQRCGSVFHACGTCRMGPDPATSVVDNRLRVYGIDRLRVIDASVFPNVTSGNTNAPTLMLADRAAALLLGE
ncbi:GMC family oxidoreductase [Rhodoligotrophos defluvii]|uniref:GMC family oxidoreductase n=1 Tax=Rhodoligotrophos defluvii TaxID=2561934 RepID=UPI0010C97756|nr:GMC family oxidoreductase N-terminal domain-containing protein [Rhodoligotrophos defluvii]